jgi:DNA-binding NarL/FixJ family response regulator
LKDQFSNRAEQFANSSAGDASGLRQSGGDDKRPISARQRFYVTTSLDGISTTEAGTMIKQSAEHRPMARKISHAAPEPGKSLPPLPLSAKQWVALAQSLRLAPQQERIVELILRGMRDKAIASELQLRVSTVRTYLNRTFARLGVDDRMALVLKLFAASHELPGPDECHRQ